MTNTICFQAVHQAAAAIFIYLKTFSPAALRRALRQAGNVVAPHDIAEVLQYVISDHQYADLDKLHLILLQDGSVQQLRYGPGPGPTAPTAPTTPSAPTAPFAPTAPTAPSAPTAPTAPKEKQYFMWQASRARELYDLMPASQHEQVEDAPAWRQIAK